MAYLPAEILHAVLQHLNHRYLAPLATVNRHWQRVVEGIIWKSLRFDTRRNIKDDIGEFRRLLNETPGRRALLQELWFVVEDYLVESLPGNYDSESEDSDSAESELDDGVNVDVTVAPRGQSTEEGACRKLSSMEERVPALRRENARLFGFLKSVWDELSGWGDDARLTEIKFRIEYTTVCRFLRNGYKSDELTERIISVGQWFSPPDFPRLPLLPTVQRFTMYALRCDMWPVLLGFKIANTLPSLEMLIIHGNDLERAWPNFHMQLREAIATQILSLPQSLRTMVLPHDFHGQANHDIKPSSLLVGGTDNFSRALNNLSTHLTTLAISVNYLTPEIFRVPRLDRPGPTLAVWPNLKILDIRTGFERADGQYWMRGPETSTPVPPIYTTGFDNDTYERFDEEYLHEKALGIWPRHDYLLRPEPVLFDELSMSIAHAVSHMPKLVYFNLGFWAPNFDYSYKQVKKELDYKGWGFYFRASNEAKRAHGYFYNRSLFETPGIDLTDIERPRTEWVFQCPYLQVQWKEADEAKDLWRRRFPSFNFDIVTQGYNPKVVGKFWERRRDGILIDSDWRPCSPYISSDEEGNKEKYGDDEENTDDEDRTEPCTDEEEGGDDDTNDEEVH